MTRVAWQLWTGLVVGSLTLAEPAAAQLGSGNSVCGPGILREDGGFDLARIGPLVAGTWSEQAIGVSVATGVQSSSLAIVYDAMRGRIYVQGDGVQLPLTIVRGTYDDRYSLGWDYSNRSNLRPIHRDHRLLDESTGNAFLYEESCQWRWAPQFSWEFRSPRGTSQGYFSFISPNAAVGAKWNSAMGAREVILRR